MSQKAKYLSLVSLQQTLPVFFQPWWLDIVSSNWDIALAEDNGMVQAVLPYCIDKKLGLTIIRNPLLTPYLGPYFIYPSENMEPAKKIAFEEKAFNQLWAQLPRWDSFDVEATTAFENFMLFQHKGFSNAGKITYEIDLSQPEDVIFAAMHNTHKNLIRQAEASHEVLNGATYSQRLIQLHQETFRRKNKNYPFGGGLIQKLITTSEAKDSGKVFAAKDNQGNISAGIFTVWDKRKMYLLLSAVDADKAHQGAARLLIWKAIQYAKAKGLMEFDFEGSMDPGIEAFFRRFGGTRKTYFCFTQHQSKLWKLKKALLG